MSYQYEGEIQIPYEDWYEFLNKYVPDKGKGAEVVFGPPRMYKDADAILVTFAADSADHPSGWCVKPKALAEQDALPQYKYEGPPRTNDGGK
jgi:hypothetical protein